MLPADAGEGLASPSAMRADSGRQTLFCVSRTGGFCDVGYGANALNKIMEKMGLLIHYGNGWGTTDAGAKFSMWHKGVLNSDAWHPELVNEVAKFLKKK